METLGSLGLTSDSLCKRILLFLEISSLWVMKLLILWVLLFKRVVFVGKFKSNKVLKSFQKSSRLVFTSVEFSTLCQDRLLSWERKFSMLVGFMSRKVLVLWCLLAEGGIIVKKFMKWSLMSDMIVPILMFSRVSELDNMWSMRE